MVNILGSPSVAKGSKPLYRGLREALGKPGVYPHLRQEHGLALPENGAHYDGRGRPGGRCGMAKEVLASVACEAAP